MSELLVVSIFATPDPRNLVWAELQRRFLEKTTRRSWDYLAVLNGVLPEVKAAFAPSEILAETSDVLEHHEFLHRVLARCRTTDHAHYLILDSDAFPVCDGWDGALIAMMAHWHKEIAAPVRFENHDTFPHPCAFFCTREGIRDPRLDFAPADYANLLGRTILDTGSAMAGVELPLLPLIRTNVHNPHPLFAAIYQHLFYHHGAGSRGVGTRLLRSGMLDHAMTDGEHRQVTARLFEELDREPEAFVAKLMGRDRLPIYGARSGEALAPASARCALRVPPTSPVPDGYPLRLDLEKRTVTFRRLDREAIREASFLDERTPNPTGDRDRVAPLDDVLAAKREVRPIRWIFHTAFVGSTLLSRCLDVPGRTCVYREPAFLTELADRAPSIAAGELDALLRAFAGLISRPGELALVKAHDRANALAPRLLALHPDSRALLIYADLETFLLATLKSPTRRRFIRRTWMTLDRSDLEGPFDVNAAHAPDHELAAALWLAIMARCRKIVADDRIESLDCRRLFDDPRRVVHSTADHLMLDTPRAELESVMQSGVLSTYAKGTRPYDSELRAEELASHRERLAREIDAAYAFLEQLAPGTDRAPVLDHALP